MFDHFVGLALKGLKKLKFLSKSAVDIFSESTTEYFKEQWLNEIIPNLISWKTKQVFQFSHLNMQSKTSSFDEFEVITLSETWLENNKYLLDYVTVHSYDFTYHNRDEQKGRGVKA